MKKEFREQAKRILSKSDNLVQFIDHYEIDYLHSYGQDSAFFLGLKQKKILGSVCEQCEEWGRDYRYATPRASCMYCGKATKWFELPQIVKIHAVTVCYGGSEAFLKETPFSLVLVAFENIDTLFLARLKNVDPKDVGVSLVGMEVDVRFAENIQKKNPPAVTDIWFEPRS